MALGDDAHADGFQAIAVGAGPSASGQQSIAIGDYVVASDQGAVALGSGSSASAQNATALGDNANAEGNEATAVGYNAFASGVSSVAMGASAGATADGSIAMGTSASANHANAVALGDASTTAADQVNIGTKRLFMGVPDSAPADVDLIDGQASLWDDGGTLTLKLKNGVGVMTSHPIITSSMFSYPGALVSGTTSPPVRLQSSQTLTLLAVTLGTAGSTNTVLDLLKNGVSVATITVVAADTEHDEVLSIAYAADTDKLALTVTTAGTGAANMTADARFT